MSLDKLSGGAPVDGHVYRPIAQGHYGVIDQIRQQVVMAVGMAVSFEDTTDPEARLNTWLFGDSHARPEFGGVVATEGNAPTLRIPVSTTNADTSAIVFAGYTPVALAPGQVVKRGQWLEPIGGGVNQGFWRVSTSGRGPARSRQYFDNSAGTESALISADLIFGSASDYSAGLIGSIGSSNLLSGTTAETAYGPPERATVTIPGYTARVGSIFRITGGILANNGAAGPNTVKVYFNGTDVTSLLATSPAVQLAANSVVQFSIDVYVAALSSVGGAFNLYLSGSIGSGVPSAGARTVITALSKANLAADNVITVTNTPNNSADQTSLTYLAVEHLPSA